MHHIPVIAVLRVIDRDDLVTFLNSSTLSPLKVALACPANSEDSKFDSENNQFIISEFEVRVLSKQLVRLQKLMPRGRFDEPSEVPAALETTIGKPCNGCIG